MFLTHRYTEKSLRDHSNAMFKGPVGAGRKGISPRLGDGWERWEGGRVTLELEIMGLRRPGREAEGRRVSQEAGTAPANVQACETPRVRGNEEQERNSDSRAFTDMRRPPPSDYRHWGAMGGCRSKSRLCPVHQNSG